MEPGNSIFLYSNGNAEGAFLSRLDLVSGRYDNPSLASPRLGVVSKASYATTLGNQTYFLVNMLPRTNSNPFVNGWIDWVTLEGETWPPTGNVDGGVA